MSINDIPLQRLKEILASDMPLTIVTTEALIARLEQAERDLVVVRESQKKIAKQFAAMGTEKGKAEWRAREAEQSVARVREVATGDPTEYGWSEAMLAVLRALDGDNRG
ncbi:hypothetical protein [Glutamicibacter sp. BW77]|uniref:hypothetical protein n=1 Tax=Glutamicibacter sp. BW77 TaxID=2024402 RepID=UPI000BB6B556|nr:hypothetical protein [Glutamicibacter sp. BW77]PCC31409.1 hypothetical protein CIK74_17190 [Glutamicibacter sp. BW77]